MKSLKMLLLGLMAFQPIPLFSDTPGGPLLNNVESINLVKAYQNVINPLLWHYLPDCFEINQTVDPKTEKKHPSFFHHFDPNDGSFYDFKFVLCHPEEATLLALKEKIRENVSKRLAQDISLDTITLSPLLPLNVAHEISFLDIKTKEIPASVNTSIIHAPFFVDFNKEPAAAQYLTQPSSADNPIKIGEVTISFIAYKKDDKKINTYPGATEIQKLPIHIYGITSDLLDPTMEQYLSKKTNKR